MRPVKKHFLVPAALLWSYVAVAALAADIKVIANPSVTTTALSSDELKGIFLETKTSLADGSHVEPVVLKSGAAHQSFVRQFIGKTDVALETYYRSLAFTGRGLIPKALGSDDEMIRYVARTKGAVGYVSASASTAGVKTLDVK